MVDRAYGSRLVEAVLDNQVDFAIAQLPVKEKRMQVVRIHSDEVRALVPVGHPLAGKTQILASDLAGHPLLMPKTGGTRARLGVWLEPFEDEITISMELDSTEMIKRFVLAGLGIGFVAGAHCKEEVSAGRLVSIGLGPDPMERQIGLIYRKDKALSKAALGFIEVTLNFAGTDSARVPAKTAGSVDRPGEKAGGKSR
jgi:DNA-binding transcriptional LysR family regulator